MRLQLSMYLFLFATLAAVFATTPVALSFNDRVMAIARSYPVDGTHGYWWPKGNEPQYDGCSADVTLAGTRVMKGEAGKRTYCCGWTLEVFAKAYDELPRDSRKLTPENFAEFKRLWFVVDLNGPGPSAALEKYGLGREIPAAEAMPGDFVQIWRTPDEKGKVSGHSVIFVDWVRSPEGDPIGIRYLSTQTSTNGIAENVEYYGPLGGMQTEKTYFARVDVPM